MKNSKRSIISVEREELPSIFSKSRYIYIVEYLDEEGWQIKKVYRRLPKWIWDQMLRSIKR